MKAHKVPATYYDGWEIAGTKNHFYVFYKNNTNDKGIDVKYRDVDRISTERTFFMEEDFYYIDICRVPSLVYKLEKEINDFFAIPKYCISCTVEIEEEIFENKVISDYSSFMYCFDEINNWTITDLSGGTILVEHFRKDISSYIFQRVGEIVEKDYFANYLENNWPSTKEAIIRAAGRDGDDYNIPNKNFFLEFVAVQYLRLNSVMEKEIMPVLQIFINCFETMGFEESELKNVKENGVLAFEPYFYGILLDAARGNKKVVNNYINNMNQSYVIDMLRAPASMQFITSTAPCVVAQEIAGFKAEIYFPISSSFCVRFLAHSLAGNRNGKVFDLSDEEIKCINNKIASETDDIVISQAEYITKFM